MLKEKNSLPLGITLGIIVPAVGFGIFYGMYELMESAGWVNSSGFRPMFRERTCAILAIALNAVLLNFYQKRYLQNTVRGLVITITLLVVAWLIVFGKYVF
ncbi:MAG: hypothetical protein HY842_02385 [Bacteroidetes bacterium]|nr:hypothetical protein [Bacteroidota bacterium]